jgi:hypothetical protein
VNLKARHAYQFNRCHRGRPRSLCDRKIKAATAWHAANGAPLQDNWRELVLSELIRRAEDIDADAIIGLDYETDGIVPVEETGVQLKRILATGIAVKLSCAA